MRRLGDLLLERGLITDHDYAEAESVRRQSGELIGATLVRIGALSEDALLRLLSEQVGLPLLNPAEAPSADQVRDTARALSISLGWLVENEAVAWTLENGAVCVASPNMHNPAIQECVEQWRVPVTTLCLAHSRTLEPILISLRVSDFGSGVNDSTRLMELAEEAPVIDFVNSVFAEALAAGASDIHFEPFERKIAVRLRIDGVLVQRRVATREIFDAISSRIKLLSGMDIAERRLPQDGRQSIRISGRDVDVRVSTLPTTWGESLVVRLLGATHSIPDLDELGMTPKQRDIMLDVVKQPNGLVLVTGPTGSGKTTTVYRLISQLNDGVRKIVTIEDPVEFDLPGVLQMTVRPDIELDFAAGLRSILRQDPDVIFVGEIRDTQTARIAVQAALTGHLVISTVHTNSALAAISRMVDLGVEQFLLADVLRAVVGQRLLRRVCQHCATPDCDPSREQQAQALPKHLRTTSPAWVTANGCGICSGTGYQGRVGVFETARIDASLQRAIRENVSEEQLRTLADVHGFTSIMANGLIKARAGQTSYLETVRVLGAHAS